VENESKIFYKSSAAVENVHKGSSCLYNVNQISIESGGKVSALPKDEKLQCKEALIIDVSFVSSDCIRTHSFVFT